jgi:hypothetical protein
LDDLAPFKIFASLDLQSGCNQIRIGDADVEGIHDSHGHFHFRVLSFGLSNASATFQRLMNKLFAPYIGKFV